MKKQYYFLFIGVGLVILFVPIIAYVESTSIERPWSDLSCDEMVELAFSPEHQSFSDKQHIEFHKDLEKCMQDMQMQHGN